MSMAVTVPVVSGVIEMDGHRRDNDFYADNGPFPIAQMRVTQSETKPDGTIVHNIIELALTRGQINDIRDMMDLYR